MRTEQNSQVLSEQSLVWWRRSPFRLALLRRARLRWALVLLVLVVHGATSPRFGAALAAEAAAEVADNAEAGADDATDKQDDQQEDSEPSSADKSEDGAAKETDDKKSEPADEPPKKEDAEEMKSGENESEPSEAQAAVETERELEVEPPKVEIDVKQPVPPTQSKPPKKKKCIIGATATLLEKQSELQFRARVDSGAKSCSLHVEKIKIENESKKENVTERMTENIGKVIHFEVKNGDNKTHILTSKIAGYVIIKTSDKQEGKRRYKVPLTFRWKSMEKEVLVTLNNRNHMEYPLLLGRNFLRGDFLIDVELNSDD